MKLRHGLLALPLAALIAIVVTSAIGVAMNKLAIEPARGAPVVSLIIITIGEPIGQSGGTNTMKIVQVSARPSARFSPHNP